MGELRRPLADTVGGHSGEELPNVSRRELSETLSAELWRKILGDCALVGAGSAGPNAGRGDLLHPFRQVLRDGEPSRSDWRAGSDLLADLDKFASTSSGLWP